MVKLYFPLIPDKDKTMGWRDYFRIWWRIVVWISVGWFIAFMVFTIIGYFYRTWADAMSQILLVSLSVATLVLFVGITIVHIADVYIVNRKRKVSSFSKALEAEPKSVDKQSKVIGIILDRLKDWRPEQIGALFGILKELNPEQIVALFKWLELEEKDGQTTETKKD